MTLAPRLRTIGALLAAAALIAACDAASPAASPSGAGSSAGQVPTGSAATTATAAPTATSGAATASVAPTSVVAPTGAPTVAPSVAGATAAATPPRQTDTAWGRIWDALPPNFPVMPGAEPATIGGNPASAVLQLAADVANGAKWYEAALPAAGYVVDALNGPIEDGSIVIDAHLTSAVCRTQVKIAPFGGQTIATVLVGASCPFQ